MLKDLIKFALDNGFTDGLDTQEEFDELIKFLQTNEMPEFAADYIPVGE